VGDVLHFPPLKSLRLEPLWPQAEEITLWHFADYFQKEVPRPIFLSVFERKILDHFRGYRHEEVDLYLDETQDRRDQNICLKVYGYFAPIENVRFPSCH